MRFYFVAGERSGDLHGGNLIRSIKKRLDRFEGRGFGGDFMQQAGMEIAIHYRELAFMGFAEVLANLRTISKKIKLCKQDILQFNPDVIVLIDYAGFNLRIAKFAKKHGIKVFWYISPKVWAWNQSRALKLKANIDKMFVILPFEKEFFKKYEWEVDYVGNPVLDAIKIHKANKEFLLKNGFSEGKQIVALLPGSRHQEVKLIVPIMGEVAAALSEIEFGVAIVDNLEESLYQPLKNLPNVRFIKDGSYDLLCQSRAAVVTSGTATLETALFRIPQVVVYKTSPISYTIAKSLIRVPFISLVNLIAGREVVKELIQNKVTEKLVTEEIQQLIQSGDYRNEMIAAYDQIMNILDTGSASENTADLMVKYLSAKS